MDHLRAWMFPTRTPLPSLPFPVYPRGRNTHPLLHWQLRNTLSTRTLGLDPIPTQRHHRRGVEYPPTPNMRSTLHHPPPSAHRHRCSRRWGVSFLQPIMSAIRQVHSPPVDSSCTTRWTSPSHPSPWARRTLRGGVCPGINLIDCFLLRAVIPLPSEATCVPPVPTYRPRRLCFASRGLASNWMACNGPLRVLLL